VYERAGFDLALHYSGEPVPQLNEEDKAWADALLQELYIFVLSFIRC